MIVKLWWVFCLLFALVGCASVSADTSDLPAGDMTRGAALFDQTVGGAPACNTCHTIDGTTRVGPSLLSYSETAGTRVAGQSALDYTYNSIVHPAGYLVSGYTNLMYSGYERVLDRQQIADLVAYLLTL